MSLESKLQVVLDTKAAVRCTTAHERLAKLYDEGSMVEFDTLVKSEGGRFPRRRQSKSRRFMTLPPRPARRWWAFTIPRAPV